jgi:hypothetical protein
MGDKSLLKVYGAAYSDIGDAIKDFWVKNSTTETSVTALVKREWHGHRINADATGRFRRDCQAS